MNSQLEQSFLHTYSGKQYRHAALVNHRGTVVAFAMDENRIIYYTVLDLTQDSKERGEIDANFWLNDPLPVAFPREIEQVGFGVVAPVTIPAVKTGTTHEVDDPETLNEEERDPFLSTTARLTADAPFQVLSDNQHIYIFRQAVAAAAENPLTLYKLNHGGASAADPDPKNYVTDTSGAKVPLVNATLLVDRFVLAGTQLIPPREVRFRRSRNRTFPASAKDSLGAKDMEGNPFYEPTKELDVIDQLDAGNFSVLLLPTIMTDVERWQIFAYDPASHAIRSFNIERGSDGFFNTEGTQLYTSPDPRYTSSVLERQRGKCPFTGKELVPVNNDADSTGLQEASFSLQERTVAAGLTAHLYYEQEELPTDKPGKTVKQHARVLLVAATAGSNPHTGESAGEKKYIAAVDFSVSRAGKLTELPPPDKQVQAEINNRFQPEIDELNQIPGIADLPEPDAAATPERVLVTEQEKETLQQQIATLEEITRLEEKLAICNQEHFAIFYKDNPPGDYRFQLKAKERPVEELDLERNDYSVRVDDLEKYDESTSDKDLADRALGNGDWKDAISYIECSDRYVVVYLYRQEDFNTKPEHRSEKIWTHTGDGGGSDTWSDDVQSIRVELSPELERDRAAFEKQLAEQREALAALTPDSESDETSFDTGQQLTIKRHLLSAAITVEERDARVTQKEQERDTLLAASRTIPLPPLLGSYDGATEDDDLIKEISSLQGDKTDLDEEISRLDQEIGSLQEEETNQDEKISDPEKEIRDLENEINNLKKDLDALTQDADQIPVIEREITRLNQTIADYKQSKSTAQATFYNDHPERSTYNFNLFVGQEEKELTSLSHTASRTVTEFHKELVANYVDAGLLGKQLIGWKPKIVGETRTESYTATADDQIRYIELSDPHVVRVILYEDANFGGEKWIVTETGTNDAWRNRVSSIQVEENENFHAYLTAAENDLKSQKDALKVAQNAKNIQNQIRIRQRKRDKLRRDMISIQLAEKRAQRFDIPQPQPLARCHTDGQGLTIRSGLLGFAYTDAQPALLESALGRLKMYFKGLNNQFFAAYYDLRSSRAEWELTTEWKVKTEEQKETTLHGIVRLHSQTSDITNNETVITVSDGRKDDLCTVTIENPQSGFVERWPDVPRDAQTFAAVLNGPAMQQKFIGKLGAELEGGSVTTLTLLEKTAQAVPVHALLVIKPPLVQLEADGETPSGSNNIHILSSHDTAPVDSLIYLQGDLIGKLKAPLTGTAVTTLPLQENLAQAVPAHALLVIQPPAVQVYAAEETPSGSSEIAIPSNSNAVPAGSPIYMQHYDSQLASVTQPGYTLDQGSLTVTVTLDTAEGNVQNGTAIRYTKAGSPAWVPDTSGTALLLDGSNHYLTSETPHRFARNGDITMEAWVNPTNVDQEARLITAATSEHDSYTLGVVPTPYKAALSLKGKTYIDLPNLAISSLKQAFTLEAWVKLDEDTSSELQPIVANSRYDANRGLHFYIRNRKPHLGFTYDNLDSTDTIPVNEWVHLACTYDGVSKMRTLYVNGEQVAHDGPVNVSYFDEGGLTIGRFGPSYMHAALDEVRIWNVARSEADIKGHMHRQLGGNEPGLLGYYFFHNRDTADRSGNGHHGHLVGTVEGIAVVDSPLRAYHSFAGVDGDFIRTTQPLITGSWQHLAAVFHQSYALQFDGHDYADAGNSAVLDITDALTIEASIKVDTLGRKQGILGKGTFGRSEGDVPYALYIDEAGKLVFGSEVSGTIPVMFKSEKAIQPGTFTRIAVVRQSAQETIEEEGTETIEIEVPKEGAEPDDDGNIEMVTRTRKIKMIKSIDVQELTHLTFYIDGQPAGHIRHESDKPAGNNDPLYLGQCRLAQRQIAQFNGTISEIRLWNRALEANEVGKKLAGDEAGMAAWWRMEENGGHVAYDSKGDCHARLHGAAWVKTPEPNGSTFIFYQNGIPVKTTEQTLGASDPQFTMGARTRQNGTQDLHFAGAMEEVRIWKTARSQEQILDNLFARLKGEKQDLIVYYTFDHVATDDTITVTEIKDSGLKSNHLKPGLGGPPEEVLSTAPISNDTAQVRSALAGIKTDFHDTLSGRPAVAEYADLQQAADGSLSGVHKRCYAYIHKGKWQLITGYKVGNLVTEWIGQAQFDPQVIGYIEGAPPVPSENITEGNLRTFETFNGRSEVRLIDADNVTYTVSAGQEDSFTAGFEGELTAGTGIKTNPVAAPLGVGVMFEIEAKFSANVGLSAGMGGAWSSGESYSSGQKVTRTYAAAIGGSWEQGDEQSSWVNPALTRRWVPANMGFAFVESETADVFALRVEHTGTLVALRMRPNPDIPRDINIIPFPINNRYTKQGTLDGRLGYTRSGNVYDPDYKNARGYGEYSYYKPREAYMLKKRIERETQRLTEWYKNFQSDPPRLRSVKGLVGGATKITGSVADFAGADVGAGMATMASGMGQIGSALKAATESNDLAEKYARRNLVNTYVWTADGGFFAESTQISEVRSRSASGSYTLSGTVSGGFSVDVGGPVIFGLGLSASLGGSMNETRSKTEESERSFELQMTLDVPDDLQKYQYAQDRQTIQGVYDKNGNPVNQPGKVDAYRFMTFYLEPERDNTEDLFGKVIDPIWLEQSQHPNAAALREANQPGQKPKCWRIFHRVTFVSRILPEFPTATEPFAAKLQEVNIGSSYELVRRLDKDIRNSTTDWNTFKDAVQQAVRHKLPEMSSEEDLGHITRLLADYYSVVY